MNTNRRDEIFTRVIVPLDTVNRCSTAVKFSPKNSINKSQNLKKVLFLHPLKKNQFLKLSSFDIFLGMVCGAASGVFASAMYLRAPRLELL